MGLNEGGSTGKSPSWMLNDDAEEGNGHVLGNPGSRRQDVRELGLLVRLKLGEDPLVMSHECQVPTLPAPPFGLGFALLAAERSGEQELQPHKRGCPA